MYKRDREQQFYKGNIYKLITNNYNNQRRKQDL